MYWNIERTRLLDVRRPLQSEIRSIELYFDDSFRHAYEKVYEEGDEKWLIRQRQFIGYAPLSFVYDTMSKSGVTQQSIDVIKAASTIMVAKELGFVFYPNGLSSAPTIDTDVEEDSNISPYRGGFAVAIKRYHALRKQISPIKTSLASATNYCKFYAQNLSDRFQSNLTSHNWKCGQHMLSYEVKMAVRGIKEREQYMLANGVSGIELAKYNKWRKVRRTTMKYKYLQYWKNGVECNLHFYRGAPF